MIAGLAAPTRETVRTTGVRHVGAVSLIDPRAPDHPEIQRLTARGGGAVSAIAEQGREFRAALDAELLQIAGTALPLSVQTHAHLATAALGDYQLARYLAHGIYGRWAEADLDSEIARDEEYSLRRAATRGERVEKAFRTLAGLAVVARDLIKGARDAAREARAEAGSTATQGLFARLGVGRETLGGSGPGSAGTHTNVVDSGLESAGEKKVVDAGAEVCLEHVPLSTPGVGGFGAPLTENPYAARALYLAQENQQLQKDLRLLAEQLHALQQRTAPKTNPFAAKRAEQLEQLQALTPEQLRQQPRHALSLLPKTPGRWVQRPGTAGLPGDWLWVAT